MIPTYYVISHTAAIDVRDRKDRSYWDNGFVISSLKVTRHRNDLNTFTSLSWPHRFCCDLQHCASCASIQIVNSKVQNGTHSSSCASSPRTTLRHRRWGKFGQVGQRGQSVYWSSGGQLGRYRQKTWSDSDLHQWTHSVITCCLHVHSKRALRKSPHAFGSES